MKFIRKQLFLHLQPCNDVCFGDFEFKIEQFMMFSGVIVKQKVHIATTRVQTRYAPRISS